ncbi:hypothetical protein GHK62_09805 [Sinorhizobium terangae]|uniref:Uncharacterized protein n=1 Tax=Sinorhizobium terangae TaxID=110322 RepID=A0A6N7LB28_SINTE|nr:hypothetical protein [Sinorhizobium terangae]
MHDSLNRNRFKDKMMRQFKVLQRPLRVRLDARRCNAPGTVAVSGATPYVHCDCGAKRWRLKTGWIAWML